MTTSCARLEHRSEFGALRGRLATRIDAELAKAMDLQLLPGQTQLDFGVGRFFYDETLPDHAGAFLNFYLRSRIDFTQNCLAVLIGYEQWQQVRMQQSIPRNGR